MVPSNFQQKFQTFIFTQTQMQPKRHFLLLLRYLEELVNVAKTTFLAIIEIFRRAGNENAKRFYMQSQFDYNLAIISYNFVYLNNMQQSNNAQPIQPIEDDIFNVLDLAGQSNGHQSSSKRPHSSQKAKRQSDSNELMVNHKTEQAAYQLHGHSQNIPELPITLFFQRNSPQVFILDGAMVEEQPAQQTKETKKRKYKNSKTIKKDVVLDRPLTLPDQIHGSQPISIEKIEKIIKERPVQQNAQDPVIARPKNNKNRKSKTSKIISRYALLLIASNQNLTIKCLWLVIYQIISKTNIGVEIMQSDPPLINPQLLQKLKKKFDMLQKSQKKYMIDTRRRIYDAINVLVGSGVIQKANGFYIMLGRKKNVNQECQPIKHDGDKKSQILKRLYRQMAQKELKIGKKRQQLEQQKKQMLMASWLHEKNKRESHSHEVRLNFPMFAIPKGDHLKPPHIQNQNVVIRREKPIEILDERQIIKILYDIQKQGEKQG